jgi:hypothetical protein
VLDEFDERFPELLEQRFPNPCLPN